MPEAHITSIITEKDAGVRVPSIIPGGNVIPFSNVGYIRNAIFQNGKGTNITGRRADIFIQRVRFGGFIFTGEEAPKVSAALFRTEN